MWPHAFWQLNTRRGEGKGSWNGTHRTLVKYHFQEDTKGKSELHSTVKNTTLYFIMHLYCVFFLKRKKISILCRGHWWKMTRTSILREYPVFYSRLLIFKDIHFKVLTRWSRTHKNKRYLGKLGTKHWINKVGMKTQVYSLKCMF